jgi:isopentenyl diphosphate isomerase/L-lactate dehydrogenase-like FMN-dependent dehydrogenase
MGRNALGAPARASRRRLLQFLAASPLLGGPAAFAQEVRRLPDPMVWSERSLDKLIGSPREALDVFDFEPVAHKNVPPAHFGYMAGGVDDDATLRANREGFRKFHLRPRRLVDVGTLDTRMELFGETYGSPIVVSPTGSNRAFHEEGEVAVSRGARAGNHLTMLSTVATTSIEEAIAARGRPVWFQLYPTDKWEVAEALARRAEKAGAGCIVVTVDVVARQNFETLARMWRASDTRDCSACHALSMKSFVQRKPNFDGIDVSGIYTTGHSLLTWSFIRRLRDTVKTRLLVKGLMTAEDAALAVQAGLDGIVVSNHGGRADDSGSTIAALPDVLAAIDGKLPVLVDSGFRRGSDIAKALAMGARAVCVGRPYLWGLGAFGQPGVERVLGLLHGELRAAMMQLGAPALKNLAPAMVGRT